MELDHEMALDVLNALLKKKGLRLITSEHAHKGSCEKFTEFVVGANGEEKQPISVDDARHYVHHAVTKLTKPDARGRIEASTAEGDVMYGYPAAVLARLTETKA